MDPLRRSVAISVQGSFGVAGVGRIPYFQRLAFVNRMFNHSKQIVVLRLV